MFAERIEHWSNTTPDKTALQIKRKGEWQRIDYRSLWQRASGVAETLLQEGIESDDRVALFAQSSPEWVIAYLGIHLTGATVVPIDCQYGAEELANLVSFAEAKCILCDRASQGTVESALPELPRWMIDPNTEDSILNRKAGKYFEPRFLSQEQVMAILFTSGTTGEPKGVQLTAGNIGANIEGILKAIRVQQRDNVLNILPLHHAYASTAGAFSPLAAGATVTFSPSLKRTDLGMAMRETDVSILPGVPQLFVLFDRSIFEKIDSLGLLARTVFRTLYGISTWARKRTGLRIGKLLFRSIHRRFGKRMRFFVSGGAKLDGNVWERLSNLGFKLLEGYGLTETSPVISFTPPSKPRGGCVGVPLENVEVQIHQPDENGQGEICVRGPSVMKGYLKNQKATDEIIQDGWLHTGDLGFTNDEGMLVITGRAKEIIVLPSGKNIYPDEVEAKYQDTPLVDEICILQCSDIDGSNEGLCAAVVPDKEQLAERKVAAPRKRIMEEIGKVSSRLPSYLRINDLVLLDEPLPRTRLGKLRRPIIADLVRDARRSGKEEEVGRITDEMRALQERPVSQRFIGRLQQITGKTEKPKPSDDLEMDLGVDSLTRVQLVSVLEQEFGLEIPDEEAAQIRTVGDILEKLAEQKTTEPAAKPGKQTELSWSQRLKEPPKKSLEETFNLHRGFVASNLVRLARFILWIAVKILFRVRIEGYDKLPRSGPVLICPNHQSYIDAVVIYTSFPWRLIRQQVFIAFGEIFSRPPLSWVVKIGRVILTGDVSTVPESLRLSAQALRKNMAVCIFPEGQMTVTGDIMRPQQGAGVLSTELGVTIYPILIDGSIETISHLQPGLRPCKVRLVVGDPIEPAKVEGSEDEKYRKLMEEWRERIVQMHEGKQSNTGQDKGKQS